MTELSLLKIFLGVAFILAPLMTKRFFLNNSAFYSDAHKVALFILLTGAVLHRPHFAGVWPLFCAFGFFLYLRTKGRFVFSIKGLATCLPFLFSLISSAWFFAGVNDLHLLGYDQTWSFYAALHGSFLGWAFVGCIAFLAKKENSSRLYLWGAYLSFLLFLFVAFGIDGTPYVKRIGVVGLSLIVPLLIGRYLFSLGNEKKYSRYFAALSLLSVAAAMILALVNEFGAAAHKAAFGVPIMVLSHGFMNAIVTLPCFFLAVLLDVEEPRRNARTGVVFFDGFCVLCSGTVACLIKLDKNRVLKYSSLQGKYAQEALDALLTGSGASVVFKSGDFTYLRAEAVMQILKRMGGISRSLAFLLNLFPLFVLNGLYDLTARNRYCLFGKNDSCLAPAEENKNLFLP